MVSKHFNVNFGPFLSRIVRRINELGGTKFKKILLLECYYILYK